MPVEGDVDVPEPVDTSDYPDPDEEKVKEEELVTELTLEELKEAFRLFDDVGEGFITVLRFKEILKEIDEDFTDDEIEGIVIDTDLDKSDTIDFDEFVKLMA